MSIKCLQQDALPKLAPAAKGLPSEPFITLTELVSFVVWGAPLTSGKSGSLRQCIHEEEAAHRRAPRKERGTAAVSQATARFYGLLSQAVARSHAALWGLKQVGEQPSAVEHERVQPSYFITPRHHDLLDNELHEEISPGEQEMLDRMFDRAARERAARLVEYLDIKISADDAALLVSQYHADRRQPVADSPKIANETDASSLQPSSGSKRGRKPHSYWDAVRQTVMKKLDDDALPDAQSGDPDWSSQADLERFIADVVAERCGSAQKPPADSTIRSKAVKWMAEFRSARSAKGR